MDLLERVTPDETGHIGEHIGVPPHDCDQLVGERVACVLYPHPQVGMAVQQILQLQRIAHGCAVARSADVDHAVAAGAHVDADRNAKLLRDAEVLVQRHVAR